MITISWSQFKFPCFCLLIRTHVTIMEIQKYNWFILLHRILFIKKVTQIQKIQQKTTHWSLPHDEEHIICLCHILLNSSFSYHYGQACLIILTALLSLPETLFVLHRFHLSREELCPWLLGTFYLHSNVIFTVIVLFFCPFLLQPFKLLRTEMIFKYSANMNNCHHFFLPSLRK